MSVRAAVFDLDDTLYPYDAFVASGFRAVARYLATSLGVQETTVVDRLDALRRGPARGREIQALCDDFGWPRAIVPRLVDIVRFHRPVVTLRADAAHALASLRSAGWRLGVLTNGDPFIQRAKVRALGVTDLVDGVVYAEECVAGGKPGREAFERVLDRIGATALRTVMVGDDVERDVRGALRAGWFAIRFVTSPCQFDCSQGPVATSIAAACSLAEELVPRGGDDA